MTGENTSSSERPKVGLVLSGGGARGAYEAGVALYFRNRLGKVLGRPAPIDIITGTSVGAINACFLAATVDTPASQGQGLCDAWRSLRIEQLISLKAVDLLRAGRLLLGGETEVPTPSTYRFGGILDTSGLEQFVLRKIPWAGIRRNLRSGRLHGLAISTTRVATGEATVFVDSAGYTPDAWSSNPLVQHCLAAIGPRHALASAAIPMLFPAVKIGRYFYVDGGLRQNTPMSPAIRLGADRIIVVSLRHQKSETERADNRAVHEQQVAYPKPLFLAGKALNALLLDHTDHDIERMERMNALLEAGTAAFGSEFLGKLNHELKALHGTSAKHIQAVHIHPSRDIGEMASEFVRQDRIEVKGLVAKRLLRRFAHGEARHESDLLSYLLFDGNFADALIDLGFRDAQAKETELVDLFTKESLRVSEAAG